MIETYFADQNSHDPAALAAVCAAVVAEFPAAAGSLAFATLLISAVAFLLIWTAACAVTIGRASIGQGCAGVQVNIILMMCAIYIVGGKEYDLI